MSATWFPFVLGGTSGILHGLDPDDVPEVLALLNERKRQRELGHTKDHGDGTGTEADTMSVPVQIPEFWRALVSDAERNGTLTFSLVLMEEVAEALAEKDPVKLRAELVQVAAVALRWSACIRVRK